MELGELAKHIAKLRDTDVTNKFADEIASLESCLKNTDEKGYEDSVLALETYPFGHLLRQMHRCPDAGEDAHKGRHLAHQTALPSFVHQEAHR